jgi:hypothetical protein
VRWHFAEPLHRVGEKWNFVALADGKNLAPRLDDAGLVVRGHDADEAGSRVGEFRREPVQIDYAVMRDGNKFRALAEIKLR